MEISQKLLCFLFLASFVSGATLGGIYDLLSISRLMVGLSPANKTSHKRGQRCLGMGLLFLEDLCFAILCGVTLLLLLYFINDGVFRFLAPLGMGCGIFVYRVTIGRLMMRIADALVRFIRRMILKVLRAVWRPIRAFLGLVYRLTVKPVRNMIERRLEKRQIKRTSQKIARYIQDASRAFESKK